jgi:hypothetical protein
MTALELASQATGPRRRTAALPGLAAQAPRNQLVMHAGEGTRAA